MKMFHVWRRTIHFGVRVCNKFEWINPQGHNTNIVVYNPVVKDKTPLILRNNNLATWYMCGPTVYDSAHIGHACTYVKFDIIRRILSEFFDINVVLVMGMTDIDDKIIKKSNETGQNWQSMTQHYEDEFFSDMDSLNVQRPYITCSVTNYIPEIIAFVEKIVNKNGAYLGKDGSVYFDTSCCSNYGKLNDAQIEEPHPDKKSSLDFALWKASKADEPYWESPWGRGRPGWHIECSAIASTILGNNIDLHSGGIDLSFPHHENEEAQSCCYHDTNQWVNYWLHTGHLHLEGDTKMSKSLQNTVSIPDLLKTQTANEFRMLCLLSHYRKNVIFSKVLIEHAIQTLKKIEFFISDCNDYVSGKFTGGNIDEPKLLEILEKTKNKVKLSLMNDFHTPSALQAIVKLISSSNEMLKQEKPITVGRSPACVAAVANYVLSTTTKLGVTKSKTSREASDISKIVDVLVEFRSGLRNRALLQANKDIESLKDCDTVRKTLSNYGIDIRDVKGGKSSWTMRSK